MIPNIENIRKEYSLKKLDENETKDCPFEQFKIWFQEALDANVNEPNAMVLSTLGMNNYPSSRVVLLRGVSQSGLRFFTNYKSKKGKELDKNPKAALNFFWPELERQIRIVGDVVKTSEQISDEYFNSRPYNSRIGAWASPQSEVIPSRDWLENMEKEYKLKYNEDSIKRPEYWGGYELLPIEFEFWQGRPSRLHDRIVYELSDNKWIKKRLAP
jgi:pyridoxamine 5'-phosphate oxidase